MSAFDVDELWRLMPHSFAKVASRGRWLPYEYLVAISVAIARAIHAGGGRTIVSIPPRHGKSELISHWTPAWYLDTFPDRRVMLASYEADFAAHWGRKVRTFFETDGVPSNTRVRGNSHAADRWETTAGGSMNTAGVGGAFTGKGGDLLLVDDPVKNWVEASSPGRRQVIWDWFVSTFLTRAEPDASIFILMTRWHEDDLAGRLLREHPGVWNEIKMPAIDVDGCALCPERYSVADLEAIKKAIGSFMFGALYQQNPVPPEGGIFKRQWFKLWTVMPARFDEIIQSWDLPLDKTETSSFASGQVWGRLGADHYLIDEVHEQLDFPGICEAIEKTSATWPQARTKVIENKAAGGPAIATLKRKISGLVPYNPKGSKEARAISVSGIVEAGNVWLPHPSVHPWSRDFLEEVCTFPKAAFKDRVDAMVQALLRFSKERTLGTINLTSLTRASPVGRL